MAIVTIDETSGVQNVQGSLISDDIILSSIPAEFASELSGAVPAGQSATPVGLAVSGNGTATTADDLIQTFGANVSDVGFTIPGSNDSGLTTTGGRKIYLYIDSSNNNVVYGREANADTTANPAGRLAFAAFLDTQTAAAGDAGATGARLWLAQYLPMFHPDGTNANDIVTMTGKLNVSVNNLVNFSLEGAPSGQNLFLMFGDGTPSLTDTTIVVTGKPGNTVNTGQGGGMTTIGTNNQMIDPAEGMFFTFVKGANPEYTVPNLDQTEADVAANIDFGTYFGATSASFAVVQLQPPKAATLLITAIANADTTEKGNTYIDGLAFTSSEEVNITTVTVTRTVTTGKNTVTTDYVFTPASLTGGGITLDFSGNTAKVTGTIAGDRIKYTTATEHNRVLIDNVGNTDAKLNAAVDIGAFRLESGALTSTPLGDVSWIDDGPSASAALGAGMVRHDETAGSALDPSADDTSTTLTEFSGVANVSTDMTPGYAIGGAAVISSSGSTGGVDGLASTVFSLDVSAAGVDSGLDTTEGNNILLTKEGALVVGRISGGTNNTKAAFAIAIDSVTGILSMVQYHSIQHPTGGLASPDESVAIAASALLAVATVTDGDGDTHAASVGIGARVQIQDDAPAITGVSDLIYANSSNPSPGGTGIFSYAMGVDNHTGTFSASNSDFSGVSLVSGSVGVAAITNRSVTWASETASQAVFNVSFSYISNPALNTTTAATGTLTFDKVAGTYKLAMSAPIESYTVLTTSNAIRFIGYAQGTDSFTLDNTQPDVSVAQLSSNFFVQFSGYAEPGGGTGANNLTAGGNGAFVNGELFSQASTWVSVSGVAAGTAGDTIQKGEVLDMDFFQANPGGDTADAPTASAAGIFLKFDGINSEDLVVVLKLANASDPNKAVVTTKAFVVDNADIFRAGAALPAGYNISLDNNDGVVIFEGNDFNAGSENYVIVGAQVLVSTEGITGSGINLNPATGSTGGSSGTQAFGDSTTDNDVVKISDIGFLTTVTPDSHLTFNAAVIDADGDVTPTQVLDVTVVSGSVFTAGTDRESIQGRAGVADTFLFGTVSASPAGAMHDIISGFVSGTDKIDLSGIDANSGGGANDTFSYIGTAAFSAAGQLRFDTATNMLQGDIDGDGLADLMIELVGVGSLPAGDIVP